MILLLDTLAICIVAACAIYAARALLPKALVARITGETAPVKSCGDCSGCNSHAKNSNDQSCH